MSTHSCEWLGCDLENNVHASDDFVPLARERAERDSPMTAHETDYGFAWGNAEIIRYALMPDGTRVLGIEINGKRTLDVYISPAGRSVRVFRKGKGEMTVGGAS